MKNVVKLENEHVAVTLREDASGVIRDKVRRTAWEFNSVALQDYGQIMDEAVWTRGERSFMDYYGGRFHAVRKGDALRVRVFGRLNREMGRFTLRVSLDGPWVLFRIEDIDERLPSLTFPPNVQCESLILPCGLGRWLRKESYGCQFLNQSGLTMRWFGGLKADNATGIMAVFEEGFADSGLYAKGLWAAPAWVKSMGRWRGSRSIRYRGTGDGYVGMAKVFRQYAKDHGFFRDLRAKIAEVPAVGALHGGRIISFFQGFTHLKHHPIEMLRSFPNFSEEGTGKVDVMLSHADALKIMAEARRLGMRKGLFNLRGTFKGGYDYAHPDIWPPEPAMGTLKELTQIMAAKGDFVSLLHDNYQDFYPRAKSFPRGVIRTSKGDPLPGGFWHGGQCYIANPWAALAYARRNWKKIKTLRPRGVFVDTMACVQGYEDYTPGQRLTRAQNYDAKIATMQFYKEQRVILGSENAGDFGMAHLDFLENRHQRVPGETVPIWPLVFHDAAFCARYPGGNTTTVGLAGDTEDILWGYAVMWSAGSLALWRQSRAAFRKSLFVDAWHARVGLDEMTNHRYLTDDYLVEQTEFSSGVSVIANFAAEPRTVQGKTVPGNGGFAIVD